jgi:PKD repeat protein
MKAILSAFLVWSVGLSLVQTCGADPVIVRGDYSFGETNVPAGASNVVSVVAGDAHCLALRRDGTLIAWGCNNCGQTNVPANLSNVVSIAAGSQSSLALRNDGSIALWGQNPPFSRNNMVPLQVTNVVALALGSGAQHALILRADGSAFDWGDNFATQMLTNIPAMAKNLVAVAAGAFHCLALRSDGRVVAWGDNSRGQLNLPAAATNMVAIATGWFNNWGVRADGSLLLLGAPQALNSGTNMIEAAFASGGYEDLGLVSVTRNGTLGEYYTLMPAYPTTNIASVAAGSYDILLLGGSGAPVFQGLPVNRTVAIGAPAYFRALAVGAMPMSYQWVCNGTNIPGATNNSLALTKVQPEQAGNHYSLIASNALGMATNGAMILNELPVDFAIQPQNSSAFFGSTVNFTTAYTYGIAPFSFQWQFDNTNLLGATNSSLSLTNVQMNQAGRYSLIVSNTYGSATDTAALTVTPLMFDPASSNLMMTTNGLQFQLDSVYATNAVFIYASTDLVSWLPIFTNSPATGSVMFLDASATNAPQRFYRAVEQ